MVDLARDTYQADGETCRFFYGTGRLKQGIGNVVFIFYFWGKIGSK